MPLTQPLFFRVSQSGTNQLSCVGRIEAAELPERREPGVCDELHLSFSTVSVEADAPALTRFA